MKLNEAQIVCKKIEAEIIRKNNFGQIKWNTVYGSEQEILEDLAKIYIPKNRIAPYGTFKGYELIYSFAFYVQKGYMLSSKQMIQCKRLAIEIKKASAIAKYEF